MPPLSPRSGFEAKPFLTYRFAILPISGCDKAHFRARYSLYRHPKEPISECEIGFIARRKNISRNMIYGK